MKRLTIAAAVAAVALFSAANADELLTAKLQAPLAQPAEPLAGDTIFSCTGDTCTANDIHPDAWTVEGCRALAREVGSIASYGGTVKQLTADKLATCNKSAKKTEKKPA